MTYHSFCHILSTKSIPYSTAKEWRASPYGSIELWNFLNNHSPNFKQNLYFPPTYKIHSPRYPILLINQLYIQNLVTYIRPSCGYSHMVSEGRKYFSGAQVSHSWQVDAQRASRPWEPICKHCNEGLMHSVHLRNATVSCSLGLG